ncbi:M10 family metallopeptidase [Pseudodonghicola flavimaris]|uniref:M10 family metallopeptidase n=1 Tax=Pseudodonghicola flavimaris TaxID=3050036 RepID=A0ABT7F0J4_9RHOB|nr:M10 family metallopeptidase [Pseudodonghicola flavimaris]MDK3018113.1 M10 family metallopeptidase [Pseudodonghicola flavimaris]
MLTRAEILEGLQFPLVGSLNPMNTTGAARLTISYQYAGTTEPVDLPTSSTYTGWTAFTAAEKSAFEAALAHIETFLNVEFVEVTGLSDPDLNVGKVTLPGTTTGYGGYSLSYDPPSGDITEYDSYVVYDNTLDVSDQASLLLHELGHALGLKHPFSSPALPMDYDNNKYSIMSYTDNPDNGLESDVMMLFDVYALQDIWGAAGYNPGDTSYTAPRSETVDLIWDTGGTDSLDARGRGHDVTLSLAAGSFSSFDTTDDVVIAFDTTIENAYGGDGDDHLTGSGGKNLLSGGRGADDLRGRGGNDVLRGGLDDDTLFGGSGKDTLKGDGGNDRMIGDGGDDTLKGGSGRDLLNGKAGKDTLLGGNGNDTLKGGLGADILKGNRGKDTLRGQGGDDKFVFAKGDGTDTIADFEAGADRIQINRLGDLATVMDAASQIGADVVFDFGGGDTLTVVNTTISALGDDIYA